MIRTGREPRDTSERMILNNFVTMQRIQGLRDQALTPETVFEIHRLITEGTLEETRGAGRFRTSGERIQVVDNYE